MRCLWSWLACVVVATLVPACDDVRNQPTTPVAPVGPAGPSVRLVYAVPQDRPYRADYAQAIQDAFVDLQSWYRDQVGGGTFTIFRPAPEHCVLPQASDYYLVDTWTKVVTGIQTCLPLTYNSTEFRWILYADVNHGCNAAGRIGAASRGVAIMGRGDLNGLVGETVIGDCGNVIQMPLGRWIGGAGHELGHTFGLQHPPGCDEGLPSCDRNCLMWLGYVAYPNTYLREDDRQLLRASPYFW